MQEALKFLACQQEAEAGIRALFGCLSILYCGSLFMLMMTPLLLHAAGVTSFSIDLESKKVTVMGHVSPAGVLESISKVKKAELLA